MYANKVFSRLSSRTVFLKNVGLFANEEAEEMTSVFSLINNHICHLSIDLIYQLN